MDDFRKELKERLRNYRKELEAQLRELDVLIKQNEKNLAKLSNLPEYGVKATTVRGCQQYYLIDKETGKREYAGLPKLKLVKKLIQRDYAIAVDKKLVELRKKLSKFIANYDSSEIEDVYEKLSEARKRVIVPIIEPNEAYIYRWIEAHPGNQNPFPEEGLYKTNRGEMVRSKSEKIIADALEKYNVPYQYEPMLELGYNTIYPDFVVLNLRTRKTVYWEHLGLVSDIEYATKNFKKLQDYERNGFVLGRDLITTMESADTPIDVKLVEEKIREFLL